MTKGVDHHFDSCTANAIADGHLVSKSVGNKIVEEYNYDIRGWMRGITASRDTSVIFSEAIRFENPQMPGTMALYSGTSLK